MSGLSFTVDTLENSGHDRILLPSLYPGNSRHVHPLAKRNQGRSVYVQTQHSFHQESSSFELVIVPLAPVQSTRPGFDGQVRNRIHPPIYRYCSTKKDQAKHDVPDYAPKSRAYRTQSFVWWSESTSRNLCSEPPDNTWFLVQFLSQRRRSRNAYSKPSKLARPDEPERT